MNKDNFGLIEGFGLKGNRSVLSFLLLLGLLVLSSLGLKGSHSLHTSFIKEDGSLWMDRCLFSPHEWLDLPHRFGMGLCGGR